MKFRTILILCLLLAVLTACRQETVPANLRTQITLEAGAHPIDANLFLTDGEGPSPVLHGAPGAEQLCTPGSYPVQLEYGGGLYDAVILVQDTVAPRAQITDLVSRDGIPEAAAFLSQVTDATAVTVSYLEQPRAENGTQTVTLILTDTSGNRTVCSAQLTLDLDVTPPTIFGVKDILADQGTPVAYRSGITVTDDRTDHPTLTVDTGGVDLSQPGVYTVIYRAKDEAGNLCEERALVTVRELGADTVPLETVYTEVDALLSELLEDGMSQRQQLYAILRWFWRECRYVSHSDKGDLHQAAYTMLTTRRSDCYGYFALSKLMLERLGIPNLDIQKLKNDPSDSNHYWCMVSLDGGQTWYHYDCSPREDSETGEFVRVFLFTDSQLDDFSRRNGNCYNRDTSLYPATPEK